MSYLSVQIGHGISHYSMIGILRITQRIIYCESRNRQHIQPAASQAKIEGCLSFDDRTFHLKSAFDQTDGECAAVIVEITVTGSHINDRRHSSAVACRKAALVEIHIIDHIGIEAGKHACKMSDRVQGDAVHKI